MTVSPGSGSGATTIQVTATANTTATQRTGTVIVAGTPFAITQGPASIAPTVPPANGSAPSSTPGSTGCTVSLSPSSVSASAKGYRGGIVLTASAADCTWAVATDVSWIQPFPLSGTNSGTIAYVVQPHFGSQARSGAITINGQSVRVTQEANSASRDERLIGHLYAACLGRVASPQEIAGHQQNLRNGTEPAALVNSFLHGPEFQSVSWVIAGLYIGLLNRDAEFGGWQFQRDAVFGGIVTTRALIANFLTSAEYTARFGQPTDGDFVRLLYRHILLREPTTPEVTFQSSALRQISRAELAANFLESLEFRQNVDGRLMAFFLYATLLRRSPTADELQLRLHQWAVGADPLMPIRDVLQSQEFAALLQ